MFIPVLINLIHYDDYQWGGLFYKFAWHCHLNDWPLIADEHFFHNDKLRRNCPEYWQYELLPQTALDAIWQYHILSGIPKGLTEREGFKLGMTVSLQKERYEPLERFLEDCILDIKSKFDEPIEGFIVFEETAASLSYLSSEYGIPIIYTGRGSLRDPTYRLTSYFCFSGLTNGSKECKSRYQDFLSQMPEDTRWLDRKELLAVFLEKNYLHYIRLHGMKPQHAVTVLGNFTITPLTFAKTMYCDFELLSDIIREYGDNYRFRGNPMDPYGSTYSYSVPSNRRTAEQPPFMSLIRAKRVATTGTNMIVEAMLWGRDVCCKPDVFSISFMCKKSYDPEEYTPVPLSFLSFYCFVYLVPYELAFDKDYASWRAAGPSEKEIYERHINLYLAEKNISPDILALPPGERLKAILHTRGVDQNIGEPLGHLQPLQRAPLAFLRDGAGGRYSCVNHSPDGKRVVCRFRFTTDPPSGTVVFQAINLRQAADFSSVRADGKNVTFKLKTDEGVPSIAFTLGSDVKSLEIIWNIPNSVNSTGASTDMRRAYEEAKSQRDAVLNSTAWKATAPLRAIMDKLKSVLGRN